MSPSCVLTVHETALIMKVSEKTIYRLIKDGELPCVKVRGSIRIPSLTLEAYIEKGGSQPHER